MQNRSTGKQAGNKHKGGLHPEKIKAYVASGLFENVPPVVGISPAHVI